MKIIEVSESKIDKMSGCVEEMLLIGGKLMQCLEELDSESYGERNTYGMRGGHMGYRDDEWAEEPPVMSRYGERGRRRNRFGRYV